MTELTITTSQNPSVNNLPSPQTSFIVHSHAHDAFNCRTVDVLHSKYASGVLKKDRATTAAGLGFQIQAWLLVLPSMTG
ncbi:hypothetical protein PSCICE_24420 [Pseudomonas cichorii]|nr:hypothetical protein PSCICE_24420 [Pseudomonas cichorii]